MKPILLYPFRLILSLLIILVCIGWSVISPKRFLAFWTATYELANSTAEVVDLIDKIRGLNE